MVGRNGQANRFNVSPIYLTCDNNVNTIPAVSQGDQHRALGFSVLSMQSAARSVPSRNKGRYRNMGIQQNPVSDSRTARNLAVKDTRQQARIITKARQSRRNFAKSLPGTRSVHKFLVSKVEEALGCARQRAKSEIPAEWSESWGKTLKCNSRPRSEYLVQRDTSSWRSQPMTMPNAHGNC